ncbi:MAG TPA: response regulator transcription factor [Gemmatimonadaceae bacterium]|jgi:DNA-binding NarL/FixJ family response regulator
MDRPTLLLADDHIIVADGLRSLLKDEFDLVGSVADGPSLVDAAARLRPDVIVSDLAMPGLDALGVLRRLAPMNLPSRVVVLTMHADAHLATEAFRLGAWGYVLKNSAGEELIIAIREVLAGRAYLTPLISRDEIASLDGIAPRTVRPTVRQRQVLHLIAEGKRMKEIAAILHLSPRTVESHKYEMMESLGLRSTAELIQYALRNPDLSA